MKTFKDLEFKPYRPSLKLISDLYDKGLSFDEITKELEKTTPNRQAMMYFPNGWGVSVLFGEDFYSNEIDTYEVGILYKGDLCDEHPNYPFNSVLSDLTSDEVTEVMINLQKSEPLPEEDN